MTTLPQTTSIQLPRPVTGGPIGPVAPALAGAGPAQMTASDIWRVIRTNMWLIVGSVLLSTAVGFGLNWYLNRYWARYTATGYVSIQPYSNPWNPDRNAPQPAFDAGNTLIVEQRSQATMLKTDALFTQVLQNVNAEIRKTDWFKQFKRADGTFDAAEAKDDLYEKFLATPIADSKLIAVSFTYRTPRDCSIIVKDIVNQHIENERKRNSDKSIDKQQFLGNLRIRYENRIKELKQDTSLKAATLQLDGYGRPGGVGQKETEIQQLVIARLKAESEASEAKGAFDSAKSQIEQGATPSAVEMMVNQNPMVVHWKQNVAELEVQLRSMPQGEASPAYKRFAAQRDAAQNKLDEIVAEERANNTVMYMDQLNGRVSQTQKDLDQITKQIDKIKSDLADMTTTLSDYLTKKDEEQGYQELLTRVRSQLEVLGNQASTREMNTVDWGPLPETPDTPSFPKIEWVLTMCILMGLALSLGISFAKEIMDTSVRSPRDIARVGQMNLLGMIPHEDDDPQSAGVPLATVIYGAPTSIMAEQFRQVRTRLQHAASLDTTRSILVTSPGPGDGKSTVACNLAAGLALNGRKILLVDANFRRPELHKIFGLGNEAGFSTVLNSIESFESAVRQTKIPNLDVITTGPKPGNATELLESQLLIDFIERALEEYDHIVFDSGPMLVVSETVALAPRVDGVVTVVRARSNSRGLLQRMRDALRQLKAEHLGVVLNAVRATGGGYYGRNIKTYYEYQDGAAQQHA